MPTLLRALLLVLTFLLPATAWADVKAEIVVDLRTGNILHERNSQEPLHPASLTKMMTIYVTFDAIKRGEISLDSMATVSAHAASQPPSKMNLRAGQAISVANLIRGTAIQSANDAASALAEAVSGSEKAFVARMNATAQAMGLQNTAFRNPHGLTQDGQMSSARDLAALGRRLWTDHPEHFGLFGLREAVVEGRQMVSTNRRFLSGYNGATGLKTGYTRAAGYNLAATAQRGGVELLAVVLGAGSSPERFDRASNLLDSGFGWADPVAVARAPQPLPAIPATGQADVTPPDAGMHGELRAALLSPGGAALVSDVVAQHGAAPQAQAAMFALPQAGGFRPIPVAAADAAWGVQIGLYPSRFLAEKTVLETTLAHLDRLGGSPHSIVEVGASWSAAYVKMGRRQAESVCRHLMDNGIGCAIFRYTG